MPRALPSRCPRCQQPNRCGPASGQPAAPCWCRRLEFGPARWPARPGQCLCPRCALALGATEAGREG